MSIWQSSAWHGAWARLGAALLPQPCLLCGGSAGRDPVCKCCAAALPRVPFPACPQCAQALGTQATAILACGACLSDPPAFDATFAAYRYAFPTDRLVQAFKYGHRLSLAPFLGNVLAVAARDAFAGTLPDAVVAVPLAPARLAERGFNQSRELAAPVAAALRRPLLEIVRRTRETASQADLPWRQRARNVKNAFASVAALDGQHLLVVDDVMTTGATLDAIARALKDAGARRVSNLVLARTVRDQADAA